MNNLVTIIIPVYNVEERIAHCLDSVIAQTYHNLEILLIDDGSTDDSGGLCDEFARNDLRFKIIHIKNQGVSHARNIGIKKATGRYITFIDADDRIEPYYLKLW